MPFSDELSRRLTVLPYDPGWPRDFITLTSRIEAALGTVAVRIDHIGSTSVPGLVATDCIDLQVRVDNLDEEVIVQLLEQIGFRVRPEPWNRVEVTSGKDWPKLVFAPPVGERASNVHVREVTSDAGRRNLLFRDFLRADDAARNTWGDFKQRLASVVPDIYEYGQVKAAPTEILMIAAENWACRTGWTLLSSTS
ncbi:MAG: GrpB family protein [Pseudonocardiaceae bacterium]